MLFLIRFFTAPLYLFRYGPSDGSVANLFGAERRERLLIIVAIKAQGSPENQLHPLGIAIASSPAVIDGCSDQAADHYIPVHSHVGSGDGIGIGRAKTAFDAIDLDVGKGPANIDVAGRDDAEFAIFVDQFAVGTVDRCAVRHLGFYSERLDICPGNRGTTRYDEHGGKYDQVSVKQDRPLRCGAVEYVGLLFAAHYP